jgi:C1A family cysteine protease
MRDNSKSYSNEEFVFRWNVWRENQQFIDEHNRQNHTYYLAMNQFGDLTNAEFNKLFKGLAFDYSAHISKAKDCAEEVAAPGLPADYDWRQKGAVTHVKNQGASRSSHSLHLL